MKSSSIPSVCLIFLVLMVCPCYKFDIWLDPNILSSPCIISFRSEELFDFQTIIAPVIGKICIFRSLNDLYPETILYPNRTYYEYPVTNTTTFSNPSVLATCFLSSQQHPAVPLNCTKVLQIHNSKRHFCFYQEFDSECNNSTDNAVTLCTFEIFEDEDRRQALYEGYYTGEPVVVMEFQLVLRNPLTGDVLNYKRIHLRFSENIPGRVEEITAEGSIQVVSDEKPSDLLLPQWMYIDPRSGKMFGGVDLNRKGEFDLGKYGSFQTDVSGKVIKIPDAVLYDGADITTRDCDKNSFQWVFRAKGYHNYGQSDPGIPGYRMDIMYGNTVRDVCYEDGKIRFYLKNHASFRLKLKKANEKTTPLMTTSTTEGFNAILTDPTLHTTVGNNTTGDPSDGHETTPKSNGNSNLLLWISIGVVCLSFIAAIAIYYVCNYRKRRSKCNLDLISEAPNNPVKTLSSSYSSSAMEQLIARDNDC